jgi:hypothetical protein
MLIYSEKITSRLQYIAEVFFEDVRITSSIAEFSEFDGIKLNYSHKKFSEQEFHIQPSALLFEADIRKQNIHCTVWNELKIFLQVKGEIPFDIFSASFYLLSRYEEYLPHKKDSYGRFSHEESLAFKENFLYLPLVNLWMLEFYKLLEEKFPAFIKRSSGFSFLPTYDIDIAYAIKGRGWLRKLLASIRGKSKGSDLFDVYDWLDELHSKHQLSPIYFFLLAKRRSKYDKNLSPKSSVLRKLIKNVSAKYSVGIHPSWQSYFDEQQIKEELIRLQKIAGKNVSLSRQHYIQFTLPQTFRCLIESGIKDDYSMGYGSINGFRASFASPFYWYDLMQEKKTSLLLHPFCYMEANSHFEQKLSAAEAANELQQYFDVVRKVDGQLITIFHNHFLTEEPQWQPWRKMYEEFLKKNFPSTSLSLQEQ